jgi:hypothetical protein
MSAQKMPPSKRLLKTALLSAVFCVVVLAQIPRLSFTHLSVADGLSQGDVPAIAQDLQGFSCYVA